MPSGDVSSPLGRPKGVIGVSRSRKSYVALFLAISLAVVAFGCGDAEPTPLPATSVPRPMATPPPTVTPVPIPRPIPTPALFPYTVTDSNGVDLTFNNPPERIVAYDSAVVEILFALGEGDRVVGTHDFVSYPPAAADIVKLGGAFNVNLEATVGLEPDLVFIFSDGFLADFERAGLRVFYQETLNDDFTKIADNMRMWGRITGATSKAEALAADFEERVSRIVARLGVDLVGPSVFQDEGDLWTPGPDTLIAEVFELLKLQNIAQDVEGYAQISPEVIVERNPELIIASYGDTISDRPGLEGINAVKSGRVYVPQSDALSVPGTRYIEGIEALARYVYPGLFE